MTVKIPNAKELEKLTHMVSKNLNGVVITTKDQHIEWVNDAFLGLTEYSMDEVIGKKPSSLLQGPETDPSTKERIRECLQAKKPVTEVLLNYKKSGKPFWNALHISPILGKNGEVVRYIGVQTDLTPMIEANLALEQSNTEYIGYAEHLITLNKVFAAKANSLEMLITELLKAGLVIFKLSIGILSKINGKHYLVQKIISDKPHLQDGMTFHLKDTFCDMVVRDKKTIFIPEVGLIESLKEHPVYENMKIESYIGTPVFVNKRLYGTLNFSSESSKKPDNYSEEKELIEIMAQMIGKAIELDLAIKQKEEVLSELKKEKERAEELGKSKERFLANTSHELRTPMNIIIGMLEVLKRTDLTPKQQEFIHILENTSDNLLYLLNDLLDLSKIEAGKLEFETTGFRLKEIFNSIIETGTYLATNKNISFLYECADPDRDLIIKGDPVRLTQILYNLTSNAIKFTEQGHVAIEAQFLAETESTIAIQFNVKDTGIGIPEEKQEKIFLRFEQADSSTTRKYGGTGLGLSISKRLIELMGGKLSLESEVGRGSVFTFTLLFTKGSEADLPEKISEQLINEIESSGKSLRILLAEDNPFNSMILKEILSNFNHQIVLAENGQHAIQLLRENDFDFILMDIQMPVMDGIETTQYIRNNFPDPKSKIPIIALTAHAIKGDKEKYLKYGMNDYLSKPFKPYEIKRLIASLIKNELPLPKSAPETSNPLPTPGEYVDLGYIKEISGDDPAFIRQSITSFLSESAPVIERLEHLKGGLDYSKTEKEVHRIKPSFSMLRLNKLYELLQNLEFLLTQGTDHDKIISVSREIIDRYQSVSGKLKQDLS